MKETLGKLLTLPKAGFRSRNEAVDSAGYLSLGLGAGDAGDLLRIARDEHLDGREDIDPDGKEAWACAHALRALAVLNPPGVLDDLLALFRKEVTLWGGDLLAEEMKHSMAAIGDPAVEPLARILRDPGEGTWFRVEAAESLGRIARRSGRREEILDSLAAPLAEEEHSREVNAFAISALCDNRSTRHLPAIREAFAANRVDVSVLGDLEDIEVKLGVREGRETPKPPYPELEGKLRKKAGILDLYDLPSYRAAVLPATPAGPKTGRNDPCPCGSGKKYKKCCL